MRSAALLLAAGLTLAAVGPAACQAPPAPTPNPPLEVGALAPDFELPSATRHGVLAQPVRLSDYQGEVVVLAFFFRARTKG